MVEPVQRVKRPGGDKPLTQDPHRLRRRRIQARMKLRDLAEKSGVAFGHICDLENGNHSAGVDTIAALADALGCEIADLMPPEPVANGSAA